MTAAAGTKRRIAVPTVENGTFLRGPVDVWTERWSSTVTLDIPDFRLAELQWEVGRRSLVIRSVDPGRRLDVSIVLQGPLVPARFVVVVTGTIFEIRMERRES